eukprot:g1272.t1
MKRSYSETANELSRKKARHLNDVDDIFQHLEALSQCVGMQLNHMVLQLDAAEAVLHWCKEKHFGIKATSSVCSQQYISGILWRWVSSGNFSEEMLHRNPRLWKVMGGIFSLRLRTKGKPVPIPKVVGSKILKAAASVLSYDFVAPITEIIPLATRVCSYMLSGLLEPGAPSLFSPSVDTFVGVISAATTTTKENNNIKEKNISSFVDISSWKECQLELLHILLRALSTMLDQETNRRKVFCAVAENLLGSLLVLIESSSASSMSSDTVMFSISTTAKLLLGNALFNESHRDGFYSSCSASRILVSTVLEDEANNNSSKKEKTKKKNKANALISFEKCLFSTLRKNMNVQEVGYSSFRIMESLPALLEQTLQHYPRTATVNTTTGKKRKGNSHGKDILTNLPVSFIVLVEIFDVIDSVVHSVKEKKDRRKALESSLIAKAGLLNLASQYDLYRVNEDDIGSPMLKVCRLFFHDCLQITEKLSIKANLAIVNASVSLLKMNHEIVEPEIAVLLAYIIQVIPKMSSKQNGDRFLNGAIDLCCNFLDIYSRLREIGTWIEATITAIARINAGKNKEKYISASTKLLQSPKYMQKLMDAFCKCPDGQISNLLERFSPKLLKEKNPLASDTVAYYDCQIFATFTQNCRVGAHSAAEFRKWSLEILKKLQYTDNEIAKCLFLNQCDRLSLPNTDIVEGLLKVVIGMSDLIHRCEIYLPECDKESTMVELPGLPLLIDFIENASLSNVVLQAIFFQLQGLQHRLSLFGSNVQDEGLRKKANVLAALAWDIVFKDIESDGWMLIVQNLDLLILYSNSKQICRFWKWLLMPQCLVKNLSGPRVAMLSSAGFYEIHAIRKEAFGVLSAKLKSLSNHLKTDHESTRELSHLIELVSSMPASYLTDVSRQSWFEALLKCERKCVKCIQKLPSLSQNESLLHVLVAIRRWVHNESRSKPTLVLTLLANDFSKWLKIMHVFSSIEANEGSNLSELAKSGRNLTVDTMRRLFRYLGLSQNGKDSLEQNHLSNLLKILKKEEKTLFADCILALAEGGIAIESKCKSDTRKKSKDEESDDIITFSLTKTFEVAVTLGTDFLSETFPTPTSPTPTLFTDSISNEKVSTQTHWPFSTTSVVEHSEKGKKMDIMKNIDAAALRTFAALTEMLTLRFSEYYIDRSASTKLTLENKEIQFLSWTNFAMQFAQKAFVEHSAPTDNRDAIASSAVLLLAVCRGFRKMQNSMKISSTDFRQLFRLLFECRIKTKTIPNAEKVKKQLDDAFLCVVKNAQPSHLRHILEDLEEEMGHLQKRVGGALDLLLLLLRSPPSSGKRAWVVREAVPRIIVRALSLQMDEKNYGNSFVHTPTILHLLSTIAGNSRSLPFSSHELSMILHGMSPLVDAEREIITNKVVSYDRKKLLVADANWPKIWTYCTDILLSMLQKRPKLIRLSLAPLMGYVRAMLTIIIMQPYAVEIAKVRTVVRICEALGSSELKSASRHHIVYLLSDYFTVAAGLSVPTPEELSKILRPGVYALIDICSKYELQQLHVALDAPSRALLKLMHQNYLKSHKYHGEV